METLTQSPVVVAILFIVVLVVIVAGVLLRMPKAKEVFSKEYPITPLPVVEGEEVLDFAGHINRGNEYLGRYDFDSALAHFQEALKYKNTDPSLHFKMGRIFLQKEDTRLAIQAFTNVINLKPDAVEAYFELARIYQSQKKIDLAHIELNKALEANPHHEEILKLKARLYDQEERYEDALPLLRKLSRLNPLPKYRQQYGEMLRKAGRGEESVSVFEELLQADPMRQTAYRAYIGQSYFDMGQYTRAIEYFKQVLQDLPENVPVTDPPIHTQMGAALCNEGVRYFEAGDFPVAIARYKEALTYDEQNPDIHFNLGKAFIETKDPVNAMTHFERCIALSPTDVASYFELAVLQDEKGLIEPAIANYQKTLQLDPGNAKAHFGLGTLYGVQGQMDYAIASLSNAIRIEPDYVDAIYNLGVALERQEQFNKAMEMYNRVLKVDPSHEKAKNNLTHIRHMKGRK